MRTSERAIALKRRKRESAILLTGGTGFLGSHIAVELLKRGYPVLMLCRPNRRLSALQRVAQLLEWFETENGAISTPEVIEGFIDRPNLGLSHAQYAHLTETIDEIVHCAGSTSFAQRRKDEVERGNVEALQNVVELAKESGCYYFHYVSTAYVAGVSTGICKEELVERDRFFNVYEETKYRAERYVWGTCRNEGIGVNIYRPSIVYGDSKNGKSTRFNALYYPIKALLFLRDTYERDIRENSGKRAGRMGVRMGHNGSIYLPIRVEKSQEGSINLIPVDYFVESFMALMDGCLEGDIFHIVTHRPKGLDEIVRYAKRLFHIEGIRAVDGENFDRAPRNALEILFDSYIDAYHPYIRDTRIFSNDKAESILRRRNIRCPDFTFSVFSRCMNYAREVEWGKKLFPH